ncbi:sugar transferase [Rubripirellula sp.]|nr:sugar transferase [Rubripirellula sp.]
MNHLYADKINACVHVTDQEQSPEQASTEFDPIAKQVDPLHAISAESLIDPVPWLSQISSDPNRGIDTPLPLHTQYAKRAIDVIGSLTGILFLFPLMLVTAIAVKLSSPGEAIFSQTRVGLNRRQRRTPDRRTRNVQVAGTQRRSRLERRRQNGYGRLFTLYKFRTMVVDAEKNGAQFATQGDPRVTRLGRFMRLTRLDELPQLFNVLRGDMSLVGPRPERPEFIEELSREVPNYIDRLQLKPGVTGIAQIVNGYDNNIDSFKRKVQYDLLYLRNCCVLNDIKILMRTVIVVLTGKGAM